MITNGGGMVLSRYWIVYQYEKYEVRVRLRDVNIREEVTDSYYDERERKRQSSKETKIKK